MSITDKIIKVWRHQSLGVKALIIGAIIFVVSAAIARIATVDPSHYNDTVFRTAALFLAGAIFTMIFGAITLIADRAGERMRREREGRGGNI